jgi:hypothetical protein
MKIKNLKFIKKMSDKQKPNFVDIHNKEEEVIKETVVPRHKDFEMGNSELVDSNTETSWTTSKHNPNSPNYIPPSPAAGVSDFYDSEYDNPELQKPKMTGEKLKELMSFNQADFLPDHELQGLLPKSSAVKVTEMIINENKKEVGSRKNEGKLDYTLMDLESFKPMIEVLDFGAKKYARDNWKLGGSKFTLLQITSSLMRHLVAFLSGQDNDDESGLSHIGHMQCNLMFLGYWMQQHQKAKKNKKGSQFDDRFKSKS